MVWPLYITTQHLEIAINKHLEIALYKHLEIGLLYTQIGIIRQLLACTDGGIHDHISKVISKVGWGGAHGEVGGSIRVSWCGAGLVGVCGAGLVGVCGAGLVGLACSVGGWVLMGLAGWVGVCGCVGEGVAGWVGGMEGEGEVTWRSWISGGWGGCSGLR